MTRNLVIVESPAKAKTIEKFLGTDYKVTSSYGHIRDLRDHEMSVDIEHGFSPIYVIPDDKKSLVSELKSAAAKAETVWLASDEDREGEAISWHLSEVLGLDKSKTKRIVFHEITKSAILDAIQSPRSIDINLVNAQQARRVLDRIVGYQISPILWRKVMPQLSAGRVQSVAVRLIVEREREIQEFKSEESYRITGSFATFDKDNKPVVINAELSTRFKTEEEARAFLEKCKNAQFVVSDIQTRPLKRFPAPPFTTSTLQQEASRKLHFSVSQTMSIAQRLYESGLITYMRTDSVNLSSLCLGASKKQIIELMGEEYLQIRKYTTQSKGAQEAHEAIRPTYMDKTAIEGTAAERRLYDLIWKRTISSQMTDAQIEKTVIEISADGIDERFVATGEVIKFDGFLKVYMESRDEDDDQSASSLLPLVTLNQSLNLSSADATQRFTQHPQRYSEASLVKKMEELGIGRPSTYAPTITTILQRDYVVKGDKPAEKIQLTRLTLKDNKIKSSKVSETVGVEKGKLLPTDIGIVVNDFLVSHFPNIINNNFTANIENQFDKIAEGEESWTDCIASFYEVFHPLVNSAIEERSAQKAGERILGKDPKTGHTVSVKISRFGPVVQVGTAAEVDKPRFAALQKNQSITTLTLEEALKLFDLPRELGEYESETIIVRLGKFGPYICHGKTSITIPKEMNPTELTFDEAIKLIEDKRKLDESRIMRRFDEDPSLLMINGQYGPYLSKEGKNYKLPHNKDLQAISYEECIEIIEAAKNAAPTTARRGRRTKS